ISIISGIRLPNDEASSDSESSDSSSSDIEQDGTNIRLASAAALERELSSTELQQLHQSMSSFIKNLYQVSIIIRQNPASHDRIIKAAKIDTTFYEEHDIRHIEDKYPLANEFLRKRLGTANSRRRKYFIYREQHREKLSASQDYGTKIPTGITDPLVPKPGPEWQSTSGHQGRPSDEDIPSAQQPTIAKESTTASAFVPKSVRPVFNPETDDQHSDTATQITVASVSSVIQDHLNIPNPPETYEDATEFECPYCYTIFSYRYQDPGKRRNEWKQHVLRDLQPYICTFDGCPQANTLYERRSDWMHHEKKHHRREWSCNASGHEVYKTRNDLKVHMEYQHKGSFGMDQLDQIVDMLERPAASARFSCPLRCDD
ncbi:MAG: hypothetical protein Q9173_004435, partial [Seirophora scorigena]